ncbi:hypothetical protein ACJBUE_16805 [Ralstonia syzygii subsp. celebesensis]|uniref:hypothetical protein n=1 Tax=Ralstonia syzygii TaxID=28097 RepID=UPI00387E06B7
MSGPDDLREREMRPASMPVERLPPCFWDSGWVEDRVVSFAALPVKQTGKYFFIFILHLILD